MDINGMNQMYESFSISREVRGFVAETEKALRGHSEAIGAVAKYNQMKITKGMQDNRVSDIHFAAITGYGYNGLGHDVPKDVYASVFHGENALMRPQLMNSTHALHVALSGNLHPGDELLSPVGKPYDTLERVAGIGDSMDFLKEYGMVYRQADLFEGDSSDYEGITVTINERAKLVTIQRSKRYATRPALSVRRIGELVSFIKNIKPDIICMMDNCYGEFVKTLEPINVGADMVVGSLIKSPGGGLAPAGGYVMGRKDCIERASYHLSAPGLGKEVGASLGSNQQLYQGLFLSPVVVSEALKGATFVANIYEHLGYGVVPDGSESRHDIIQAIAFGTPKGVISFCKGIQAVTPVDSYMTPEPWDIPRYDSPVTMVVGAFVQGSSIELSADGPARPPYAVYFQGGLTWYHTKLGILKSLQQLLDDGVLKILR